MFIIVVFQIQETKFRYKQVTYRYRYSSTDQVSVNPVLNGSREPPQKNTLEKRPVLSDENRYRRTLLSVAVIVETGKRRR